MLTSLLARSTVFACLLLAAVGAASASAAPPTLELDTTYGEAATHSAVLGRVKKYAKLDVKGATVDSNRRVSLIGNNGWENPSNAGPVQCSFITVRRLTAGGAIDTSFARNGTFTYPKVRHAVSVCAGGLKSDSQGRLVGTARIIYKPLRRVRIIFRLTSSGKLDKSFGDGGTVRLGPGNWGNPGDWGGTGEPMLVEGGKLVLVTTRGLSLDFVRLKRNGSIDRSYGRNGHAIVADTGNAIFDRDEHNRIYIAGFSGHLGVDFGGKFAVVRRLTADGKLDKSYGKDGSSVIAKSTGNNGEVVWIDEIDVLGDGRAYINQRSQGNGDPKNDAFRWAVLDSAGSRSTKWHSKSWLSDGAIFTVDQGRRAATLRYENRDTDGYAYNNEGRQLWIGVAAEGFNREEVSAPLEILGGGQLEWFARENDGHDIYTITIFGMEGADDLETRFVRVQRLRLDW